MSVLALNRNKIHRMKPNPLDKTTIFSICPIEFHERKYTIFPGVFHLSPGSIEKPSILVVGSSSWFRKTEEEMPAIEVPHYSVQVAESVVKDACIGMFGASYPEMIPGLFFISGELTLKSALANEEYKKKIELAKTRQKRWFENLVKLTDAFWARSNGNPLAVPDHAKIAANELGLKNKLWLKDFITSKEMEPCPACGEMRNNAFPVCRHCNTIIDKKRYSEMKLEKVS